MLFNVLLTCLWRKPCLLNGFHWAIRRFPSSDIPDQVSKTGIALRVPTRVPQLGDKTMRPEQVTISFHRSSYFVFLANQPIAYPLVAVFLWNSTLTAPHISANPPKHNCIKDFACIVVSLKGLGHCTFPVIPTEFAFLHWGNHWLLFFWLNNLFFADIPLALVYFINDSWELPLYGVFDDFCGFFYYGDYFFHYWDFRSFHLEHVEWLWSLFFAVVNINRTRTVSMAPNNSPILHYRPDFGILLMNQPLTLLLITVLARFLGNSTELAHDLHQVSRIDTFLIRVIWPPRRQLLPNHFFPRITSKCLCSENRNTFLHIN